MRRPFLLLLATLLTVPLACTNKVTRIVKNAPAEEAPETPAEEEPPPQVEPPPTDPLVIDLGEVGTGVDVTFDVPSGALGFNVVAEGEIADFDPQAPFGIERIVDPKGEVVHDDFTPQGGTKPTSFAAFDTLASASVPQGEGVSAPIPAGTWKVRFGVMGGSGSPRLKAKVRVQSSGDGEFHGGTLDLHVHVPRGLRVDGAEVDADAPEGEASLNDRVDTFFAVTSRLLGIERGQVTFHTAPAAMADLDGVEEIVGGFGISRGISKDGTQTLHVLFTNSISDQGQPIAAGIAPGIPGAATVFGRGASGIIVATIGPTEEDVLTMVHEAGHFFGLNHTTEFDGQSADPLSDTPRCNGISGGDLQSCPDRANIMFPAGAIDGPVTLSATQKRVYRGSPIYKAKPAGAKSTQSFHAPRELPPLHRTFRASGGPLSPVERELSFGFCGLNELDVAGLVRRHGQTAAVAQLRAAAADADLSPIIRGRANVALRRLGAAP